jgi:signal transduction histidine kinase/ActR/RegA family two-component response regulator
MYGRPGFLYLSCLPMMEKLKAPDERLNNALVELGLDFGLEHHPGRLLQSLCDLAREIIGARYAVVAILDGSTPQLRLCVTSGMDAVTAAQLGSIDPLRGPLGAILNEGRSCRLHHLDTDPSSPDLCPPFPRFDSFLGAPIDSRTRVYGWLCLLDKSGAHQFSAEDEGLAGILAAQVGRFYEMGSRYADVVRHAAELERSVNEHITQRRQLEEQFRQAQKVEAVGQLAGGVAHDLGNLLTVIMGYSDIYLARLQSEDPLHMPLTEIRKAGERATGLTRQLLAFSRKQVFMPVVLDLNVIVDEMAKLLRRLIGEDVTLTVCAEQDLWRTKADPGQMEQILMNVVVNARDAMPRGGKLRLETKNVELDTGYARTHAGVKPGEYVLLAISDTGCGMDASVRARIFEPFFTTKGPTKGTGLGLATVFGIVKQSGGHIEVFSEVGLGTKFKIYLPRDTSGAPMATSPRAKEPVRGGTETVLLVEDDEGVRTLAATVLHQHGYTVLGARDGGDALMICAARAEPIDLIVTDIVMPHFSGRHLAEQLAGRRPPMKVLFMSGYADDAIFHHGVLESGTPFLQKPFTPEALARKVRELLDSNDNG